MPSFTVPITGPNGTGAGTITVNASDAAAAVQNASQGGNTATGSATQNGGGTPVAGTSATTTTSDAAAQKAKGDAMMADATQKAADAAASGNKAAFDEFVRQFNLGHDLSVSAVTGTFDGNQTQAAQKQASDIATQQAALTGTLNGTPTLAAEKQSSDLANQQWTQRQAEQAATFGNAVTAAGLTGMYSAPSSYTPGTWLADPATGKFGLVGANGQVQTFANQAAAQASGFNPQAPAPAGNTQAAAAAWQQAQTAAGINAHTEDFANQPAAVQAQYGVVAPAAVAGAGATIADGSVWGGAPATQTQAAQQQAFAQEQANSALLGFNPNGQATVQEQQLGLDALKASASMQSDPFRQQQYLQGLSAGGYSNAIDAMNGATGYATSQGGMGASAAGTNTTGYLGSVVGAGGTYNPMAFSANQAGSPLGAGTSTYNAALNALPNSANQIVGRNYLKADPATQSFITSGMSAKTGLDQATIDQQIKATMPGFKAPAFGGSSV